MDVYNRGQWQDDSNVVTQFVKTGFFGDTTYSLYAEEDLVLVGRPDGAFISIYETAYDADGTALAAYPYLVTIHLQIYYFQFVAPDFVSVLLFCQEYHSLIAQRNQELMLGP